MGSSSKYTRIRFKKKKTINTESESESALKSLIHHKFQSTVNLTFAIKGILWTSNVGKLVTEFLHVLQHTPFKLLGWTLIRESKDEDNPRIFNQILFKFIERICDIDDTLRRQIIDANEDETLPCHRHHFTISPPSSSRLNEVEE